MKPLLFCATLALLGGAAAPSLFAAPKCTNKDLNGVYAMLATGNIFAAPPSIPTGPFARVGRAFADGHGNLSIANTASYNGNILDETYSGIYTVNSDCTVDITAIVPLPPAPLPIPFEFLGALADNGNSAAVVLCGIGVPCIYQVPTGNVIRVILSRKDVNQARCTNGDLSGAFQLDMSGTVVSGPLAHGPFVRDGRLVFDGRGAFAGQAFAMYQDLVAGVQPESISGGYAVDYDCNVTLSFGGTHTWVGTLTDRGNGADLIVKESGVVITGTLKKQKSGEGPE